VSINLEVIEAKEEEEEVKEGQKTTSSKIP